MFNSKFVGMCLINFNLWDLQSVTSFWKGLGSSLMVKGIVVASETMIHEFTPLPKLVYIIVHLRLND